jgi:GT2 family glycosyltransferase
MVEEDAVDKLDAAVVMATFNRPEVLRRCLESLNRQSYPANRFEVIVVDDSGPANYQANVELIRQINTRYRLRYYQTGLPEEDYGVTVATNLGIRLAEAPLIIFTGDDCQAHPGFVEAHVRHHHKIQRLMLIGYRSEDPEVLTQPLPIKMTREKCIREYEKSEQGKLGPGDFKTGNASVKKEHLMQVGLFNEQFARPGEYGYTDRELGLRLLASGLLFKFTPHAVIYHPPAQKADDYERKLKARELSHRRFKKIQARLRRKLLLRRLLKPLGITIELFPFPDTTMYSDEIIKYCPQSEIVKEGSG